MRRELELRALSPGNSIYIETGCQLKLKKKKSKNQKVKPLVCLPPVALIQPKLTIGK